MKKIVITIVTMVFVLMAVSCSSNNTDQTIDHNGSNGSSENDNNNDNINELPPEVTEEPKQTAFDKDIQYLSEIGITLPQLSPDAPVTTEEFLSLMTKTHEAIGGGIDISMVNPNNNLSDAIKKMTLMGVYENYFIQDNTMDSIMDYGTASYWFMKLHDSIQSRFYTRSDGTATTGDLLRRINVSTALNTWSKEAEEVKSYTIGDLTEEETTLDQHLTRLLAAEMLVNAYEDINGEIKETENYKFSDTDSIYALKSNQLFFWPETDKFEPEALGKWEDWSFTSAIIYDSQIRISLELEGVNVPYGAITSAMASFIRAYEEMEQNKQEEIIVLNERPYDWFVYQM